MSAQTILILSFLTTLFVFNEGRSYQCGSFCVPVAADSCRGGVVRDACGCYECAKVEDETCGGQLEAHGYCESHLICSYPADDPQGLQPGNCVLGANALISEPNTVWSRLRNFFG